MRLVDCDQVAPTESEFDVEFGRHESRRLVAENGGSFDFGSHAGKATSMNFRNKISLVTIALGLSLTFSAQVAAAPCDSANHRAFDFWLGEWDVYTPDGKRAGSNRIEREYGGCVLHERYDTGRGYSGESLNIYDASRKIWHQSWVDTSGTLLLLEGGIRDGKMVLEGHTAGADAAVIKHRISWTPNADGSVRQHWESTDAKGAWTTAFDGKYVKKKP